MAEKDNVKSELGNDVENTVLFSNNKALSEKGVSFHWWSQSATTLHTHDFYEIFIVTAGEASHTLNGETSILKRGTVQFIKPKDKHIIIASKDKGYVHLNLCARTDKLESIFNSLGIDKDEFLNLSQLKTELSSSELESFIKKAEKINLLHFEGEYESAYLICELIVQSVVLLYTSGVKPEKNYPDWFSEILEKIHSPENIGITVSEIYEMVDFSVPVLIKYFKKFTGKTVKAYVRDMKCDRACTLLETTKMSTLKISTLLGYYSLSHFNRMFKEYTGTSPAQYRKKYLDEIKNNPV